DLGPNEGRAPADGPELSLKGDRRQVIARGRHRWRVGPPVGRGLVHLVRGARAVAAAADRVQAASERCHREAAARLAQWRAGRPGVPYLVVLVAGAQRRPAHAPTAVAADDEEAPGDDGRGRPVARGGGGGARPPGAGPRVVGRERAG